MPNHAQNTVYYLVVVPRRRLLRQHGPKRAAHLPVGVEAQRCQDHKPMWLVR